MSFHPAMEWVAPATEKAAPASPADVFIAGNERAIMKPKATYADQLKHPFWQKKRLDVLNSANFQCECCGEKEKTLHVHHKHYIKGRLAWEYEDSELEALCADCHESAHISKERIDAAISQFPSVMLGRIGSLLIGYGDEYVDTAMWEFVTEDFARAGQVAWFIGNYAPEDAIEFHQLCERLGPDGALAALRGAA